MIIPEFPAAKILHPILLLFLVESDHKILKFRRAEPKMHDFLMIFVNFLELSRFFLNLG